MECVRVGRIPNYLRTTTNKYKGLITEKVALYYLRKNGFLSLRFDTLIARIHDLQRKNGGIQEYWKQRRSEKRERCKKDLIKYSSKSLPKGWKYLSVPPKTWDEYRKGQLNHAHAQIVDIENYYPIFPIPFFTYKIQ